MITEPLSTSRRTTTGIHAGISFWEGEKRLRAGRAVRRARQERQPRGTGRQSVLPQGRERRLRRPYNDHWRRNVPEHGRYWIRADSNGTDPLKYRPGRKRRDRKDARKRAHSPPQPSREWTWPYSRLPGHSVAGPKAAPLPGILQSTCRWSGSSLSKKRSTLCAVFHENWDRRIRFRFTLG